MNFLKKLFGIKDNTVEVKEKKNPENTRLLYLLDIWSQHSSNENYKAVMDEILEGNSYLLLPSVNDNKDSNGWQTLDKGSTLKLTTVYNLDGLKVLGAFSNEKALVAWANKPTEYTAMPTQSIIEFCKEHGIDRIVINSDQKDMFVMERSRENISATTIEQNTEVQIGTPAKPLNTTILDKLSANFAKVDTIEEAYQYAQKLNNEISIVLGIKMSVVSDNSKAALYNAVNNALENENLELPLDIMILDKDDWLNTVRDIHNSLFYTRQKSM